jgi:short-subunit dehydrogenase
MGTTATRRTALITGASGGFGTEFARLFASDGFDLILVARSGAAMEEIAQLEEERHGISVTVLPKDLSKPGAARDLMASVNERHLHVDALVNNAGFSTYGPFAETDEGTLADMLEVNMTTLTQLTRACLPGMIAHGWGRVLLLGSVGSFSPAPMTAAYAATKAYVLSLGLALAEELKGTGVSVTTLCPGPTRTGFQTRAQMDDSKLVAGRRLPAAEDVADAGYAAMKRGRPYLVTGGPSRLFAFGTRFLPRTMATTIAGRSQRRIEG